MQGAPDIEKVPLLDQKLAEDVYDPPQQPTRPAFRRLKGLICIASIYAAYAFAMRAVHTHDDGQQHPHEWPWGWSGSKAPHVLTKEKAEELYLYVRLPLVPLRPSRTAYPRCLTTASE